MTACDLRSGPGTKKVKLLLGSFTAFKSCPMDVTKSWVRLKNVEANKCHVLPDSHLTNQCHSMMFRGVPFILVITTAGILLFQRCPEHRRQWRQ